MADDGVRILLVVLIMLKVTVIVWVNAEEVMRSVGMRRTMRDSMREHMRDSFSEEVVWCWVVLCHVHEVSWERHAAHVDNRGVAAHAKEWIVGTTTLLWSSFLHAIRHNLLHMLLDLLLHHMLDELGLEWAITLDCDCLKAGSAMNVLYDMVAFIVGQVFIVILIIAMDRVGHWSVRWNVDRNDDMMGRRMSCRMNSRVLIVLFMVDVVVNVAMQLFFLQIQM